MVEFRLTWQEVIIFVEGRTPGFRLIDAFSACPSELASRSSLDNFTLLCCFSVSIEFLGRASELKCKFRLSDFSVKFFLKCDRKAC